MIIRERKSTVLGLIVQWIEQLIIFNQQIAGSNPARPQITLKKKTMKHWRTEGNHKVHFELVPYVKRFLGENANSNIKIYVGCDSQNLKRKPVTGYVTVVAFHIGTTGVHLIFLPEKVSKIRDSWTRLWGEVERTMKIAEELRAANILINCIDLDFNQDDAHDSNRLVAAGEGLFRGLGYNVASKPDDLVASRAADHIIKTVSWEKVPFSK